MKVVALIAQIVLHWLSALPLRWLYRLADVVYVCLFYVVRYRRRVVDRNLRASFPEWTPEQRQRAAHKYYRHLSDLIVEVIKASRIGRVELMERCYLTEEALRTFDSLCGRQKQSILLMGHMGNWEWGALCLSLHPNVELRLVYRPLRNAFWNRWLKGVRSRFGAVPVTAAMAARSVLADGERSRCAIFVADQAAPPDKGAWYYFLNQPTVFFTGAVRLAARRQVPVVYGSLQKLRRGYYQVKIVPIVEPGHLLTEQEIMQRFIALLEHDIRWQPELWLWSHRRWKHSMPADAIVY